MATIKILLDSNEDEYDICEDFIKAMDSRQDVDLKNKRFDDPLMNKLVDRIDDEFHNHYTNMIKEIVDVLKE